MESNISTMDRVKGALLGLACGDALGTTLEFEPRGSFDRITDMVGGGPFQLAPGQWTDDTSMALCLGHSLVYRAGFDPVDQMNRYCNWYLYGYMSSTGDCFDIGGTVYAALKHYLDTGEPYSGSDDPNAAGNGSIMRLAPIPMFYHQDLEACLHYAGESSRTTHGAAECIDACRLFAHLIWNGFTAQSKTDILKIEDYQPVCDKVAHILQGDFQNLTYEELKGSGYVIDSLTSALWCFIHGQSFSDSVLMAANLGDDADTTAAVCGQMAGAYYGACGIPRNWLNRLAMIAEIDALSERLFYGKQQG